MTNALTVFQEQLAPLSPRFEQALAGRVSVERLMQTILVSCERNPKLLDCNRQSLFNAAMSAAVLGLEVDGVTGQAYLIPFKGRAQLVIGYKGFNTLAARSNMTITGAAVREGDHFAFELGTDARVIHVPELGGKGRIIAAWAAATHLQRPPIVAVLSIDELLAVKARAPGAEKSDSPWNDPAIGFAAMVEKTAKRRLARSMPLNVMVTAARLDEAFEEQGRLAYITPEAGVVVEGEVIPERESSPTPSAEALTTPRERRVPTPAEYIERWEGIAGAAQTAAEADQIAKQWNSEKALRERIWPEPADDFTALRDKVREAVKRLREPPSK